MAYYSKTLPNPMLKPDGTLVADAQEWEQQKAYLREVAQEHMYGTWPGKAECVKAVSQTMEEVMEAAKRAEIYDDIQAMPEGFDTYVGERGALLSGGQKQRVAIARIFLKNPPILILDEATSALDSVTEAKIQRAFDNLAVGRTTLIIAHRLSTIRNANRIVSIADGVITECGSHSELLQKGGIYAELYKTQNALALEAMK